MSYIKHLTNPPQSAPLHGKQQVENSAGGFVFKISPFERLKRFLILGCEGGTYYASEQKLTRENAACVEECISLDPAKTVKMIVLVSQAGRAPKNDPAIFALALCAASKNPIARDLALAHLNDVCRIGTHLFQFVQAVDSLRGWGRGLRTAVSNWYSDKRPDVLAMQVTKYPQRGGWRHRDVLRLCHIKSNQDVFQYVTQRSKWQERNDRHSLLVAVEEAKSADVKRTAALIREHGLVREHLSTEHLNSPLIWEALLEEMPITATIRNLNKMTQIGLLKPLSSATRTVCERLTNLDTLRSGRVHPFSLLVALKTYQSGKGFLGSLTWEPVQEISSALEDAYYLAFDAIEPTGKNWLFGIDVSGSMSYYAIAGTNVTARSAAACLAMVSYRTEPHSYAFGFSTQFMDLGLRKSMTLAEVEARTSNMPFSGTDCAVPMLHAIEHKLEVDAFVVLTDNETWAGKVHPCVALEDYRQRMGRDAKLMVVGMTATDFSIADPNDPSSMDFVGFDVSAPSVMADFVRG